MLLALGTVSTAAVLSPTTTMTTTTVAIAALHASTRPTHDEIRVAETSLAPRPALVSIASADPRFPTSTTTASVQTLTISTKRTTKTSKIRAWTVVAALNLSGAERPSAMRHAPIVAARRLPTAVHASRAIPIVNRNPGRISLMHNTFHEADLAAPSPTAIWTTTIVARRAPRVRPR